MEKDDRIKSILAYLHQGNSATYAELASKLKINRETVRRDVEYLTRQRVLSRENRKIFLNENSTARSFLLANGILSRDERAKSILKMLAQKQTMRITQLAKIFNVSSTTIRADLKRLDEQGLLLLHHGYVTTVEMDTQHPHTWDDETIRRFELVAKRCASHIGPNETIFLDDSPCSLAIAGILQTYTDLQVVTTSFHSATLLAGTPVQVLLLDSPASCKKPLSRLLKTASFIQEMQISKAFLSLDAYDSGDFVSLHDPALAAILGPFTKAGVKLIFSLDSSKLGTAPSHDRQVDLRTITKNLIEIVINEVPDEEIVKENVSYNYPITYCGPDHVLHLGLRGTKKIGFSFYPGNAEFRNKVAESIEQACKHHHEFSLDIRSNSGNYESIIDNIQLLIQDGIDLLIDYSSNFDVGELIVRKLNNSKINIPVIMVDLPVQNSYYYGADNVEAGQIAGDHAARFVLSQWDGRIDSIILLDKSISGWGCQQRLLGSLDSLRTKIDFSSEIIERLECSSSYEAYKPKLIRRLESLEEEDTCLVMSFGEDTTIDTYDLIKEYARTKRIVMVGQNYTEKLKQLMEDEHSPLIGCVTYGQDTYGSEIIEIATQILSSKGADFVHYAEHEWIPNKSYRSVWQ
jgi:DeoR/GlpR family transcriptional regulator of sugar metabolism/ABC-type sugar transport system substrate-binding protein